MNFLGVSGSVLLAVLLARDSPAAPIAKGTPEHALAGVHVDDDDVDGEVRRLGTADKVTDRKHSDGSDEREYEWDRDGVRLSVRVTDSIDAKGKRLLSGPVVVNLWGARRFVFAHTGDGLYLTDGRTRMKQIYGRHVEKVVGQRAVFEWSDGTVLAIDFDRHEHIVHMELDGSRD